MIKTLSYGEYEKQTEPARCEKHDFKEWRGEGHEYCYRECKLCGYLETKINVDEKRGRK